MASIQVRLRMWRVVCVLLTLPLGVISLSLAAGGQDTEISDAGRILGAHLSHGIGASPFDSDAWRDEVNATVIVKARSALTVEELRHILGDRPDLSARLLRLERDGFIRRDGERVRTAFPILIGKERDAYRALVAEAAATIENEMRADWQILLRDLNARGWGHWSYHFVWSQTMDSGFTWVPMMEQGRVPPLSQVMVWVIYPRHPFQTGTNYYPDTELRDQVLAVTWRAGAANTTGRVGDAWRIVWSSALTGKTTPEERRRLRVIGLVDEGGRVRVPVVTKADALYARLTSLGERHVRLVAEHLPLARLTTLTGAEDKLTFAMGYHDVSWDVVRRMVESGVLAVPPALREGADDKVSMVGVCALIDMHPRLSSEFKKALGIK
jgi:hypothetical protein